MDKLLLLLTSKKTTALAVLGQLLLFSSDSAVIALLAELGAGPDAQRWLVNAAKLGLLLMAALGYSPLKRPPEPE